jgi:hypothetical protein
MLTRFAIVAACALAGPAQADATTCQDLRGHVDRTREILRMSMDQLNGDDFGSEQERRDLAQTRYSSRQYIQTARAYLAHGCPDGGGVIKFSADAFDSVH